METQIERCLTMDKKLTKEEIDEMLSKVPPEVMKQWEDEYREFVKKIILNKKAFCI